MYIHVPGKSNCVIQIALREGSLSPKMERLQRPKLYFLAISYAKKLSADIL